SLHQRHLRVDHRLRFRFPESHPRHEPLTLDSRRTRHDHNPIAQGFTAGFIEKWYVSKKKFGGVAMALGFETPLTADARMQDLLQRAFFSRVGEHYRANSLPIQVPAMGINIGAKLLLDKSPHLRIAVGQLARRLVRIEKFRRRN